MVGSHVVAGGLHAEGETLGRYRLVRSLGKGATGEVHLALDTFLDVQVCIKILHPSLSADVEALARFKRELLLARRISHPGVCKLFELHDEGGVRFISMEYIEGAELRSLLGADEPLPISRALRICRSINTALAAAHDVGVIHRDLKPRNIIVRPGDEVSILDFGIATSLDSSRLTRPGVPLGTRHYIAPEVWAGDPATQASDLFAVGVILYNCLTARMPFAGEGPTGLLEAMRSSRPMKPSDLVPDVPRALDDIVHRALALGPRERFASARDFEAALAAVPAVEDGASRDRPSQRLRPVADAGTERTVVVPTFEPITAVSFDPTLPPAPRAQSSTDVTTAPQAIDDAHGGLTTGVSWVVGGEAPVEAGAPVRSLVGPANPFEPSFSRQAAIPTEVVRAPQATAVVNAQPPVRSVDLEGSWQKAQARGGPWISGGLVGGAILAVAVAVVTGAQRPEAPVAPATVAVMQLEPAAQAAADAVAAPAAVAPVAAPAAVAPVAAPAAVAPVAAPAAVAPVQAPRRKHAEKPRERPAPPRPVDADARAAWLEAKAALEQALKERGLLAGDAQDVDAKRARATTLAEARRWADAAAEAAAAQARVQDTAINRRFVSAKLVRFNQRFDQVQDDEERARLTALTAAIMKDFGAARFAEANRGLNRAFAALAAR